MHGKNDFHENRQFQMIIYIPGYIEGATGVDEFFIKLTISLISHPLEIIEQEEKSTKHCTGKKWMNKKK